MAKHTSTNMISIQSGIPAAELKQRRYTGDGAKLAGSLVLATTVDKTTAQILHAKNQHVIVDLPNNTTLPRGRLLVLEIQPRASQRSDLHGLLVHLVSEDPLIEDRFMLYFKGGYK